MSSSMRLITHNSRSWPCARSACIKLISDAQDRLNLIDSLGKGVRNPRSSPRCLFKFYGPYLSQLTIAFPGLWARSIPYWSLEGSFGRLSRGIKINSWTSTSGGKSRRGEFMGYRGNGGHFHDSSDS